MPTNHQTDSCISTERGALVFWAPPPSPRRQGCKVQIIDVFSLQMATGYTRDPQGKLLLEAQSSVGAGRSWSLAKAAQLIRNDARPHRWVALELNKWAWGLFWAGGGCSGAVRFWPSGWARQMPVQRWCLPRQKRCCAWYWTWSQRLNLPQGAGLGDEQRHLNQASAQPASIPGN
jgi:hypothetical protein